jgi:hypothetical protein
MITPWPSIRQFYEDLASRGLEADNMLQLVAGIESSAHRDHLFGWTSMHDLFIVQTQVEHPYNGPYLRISPSAGDCLEFRYIDTFVTSDQWHRTAAPGTGLVRLADFMASLHWVPGRLQKP